MFRKWFLSYCWPNCFVIKNTNYVWYSSSLYTLCKYLAVCGVYASHTWMKPNRTVTAPTNNNIVTTQFTVTITTV